jgi:hypothetical protein
VDPAPCFVFRTIWNHVFTLCFVVLLSATIKILFSPCRQSGDLVIGSSGDRFQDHSILLLPLTQPCNRPDLRSSLVTIFEKFGFQITRSRAITRSPDLYFAPVLPTFFFNFSPT